MFSTKNLTWAGSKQVGGWEYSRLWFLHHLWLRRHLLVLHDLDPLERHDHELLLYLLDLQIHLHIERLGTAQG